MPKRKLCIIMGGHFSATRGGAQYQAEVLVNELVATGEFDIHYICRHVDSQFVPRGYAVEVLRPPRLLAKFGFYVDTLQLHKMLVRLAPDIIYQRGLKAYTGVAARYAKDAGCRFVFHAALDLDVLPMSEIQRRSLKGVSWLDKVVGDYGLRRADAIIAQTQSQASFLKQFYGLEATAVIKNFHPIPKEPLNKKNPVSVVWVANFKRAKRPELFAKLARDLASLCDARFIMIGRPGDPGVYGSLLTQIEELSNVTYLGEMTQGEVNEALAKAHVFVNTSLVEGFPNTFIQAWMRRVPIVAFGIECEGIFEHGVTGFCARSYEELKSYVLELVLNDELRKSMGDNGYEHALAEHSTSNVQRMLEYL